MTCTIASHLGSFPSSCDECRNFVKSVVSKGKATESDYQIYLQNGGFSN